MSFWQHLTDSYDKNADALKKTYPLSTTSISNNGDIIAIIVIDGNGNFVRSDKIEKSNYKKGIDTETITIPATEKSLRRSSTAISPYPVFEEYGYLKGMVGKSTKYIEKFSNHCDRVETHIKNLKKSEVSEKHLKKWKEYKKTINKQRAFGGKVDAYIEQLKGFSESEFATGQVKAIYRYIAKRTVVSDLASIKMKDKMRVIFQVEFPGNPQAKMWKDEAFFSAWHQYYLSVMDDAQSLDYITGTVQQMAASHPKKISNGSANAKLVSDNDKTNYTFRGKFSDSSEAVSIGYETSQKAHQFLRYLINDRGYYCGEQVILSFAVGSVEKLLPPPIEEKSIWSILQESQTETESDVQINLRAETGIDYADALRKSLAGFGHGKVLEQHAKTVVLALDAATTGRLAITFYRELDKSEYLEKVADWHRDCKWHQKFWSKEKEKYIPYIGAPFIDRIIEAVYGKPRAGKDESYIKIKKVARERLLRCIFDGVKLPADYVIAAVRRGSNPLGITTNGKFDRNGFEQVLSTACALVRKDYQQHNKEDYKLSVELDRTDRDYLYGRLLGAADKLEEYALHKKNNDRVVTAAIRHMQTFAQHPFRTWQTIHACLNPYIQTVKYSFAFGEIQAVMDKFLSKDYEKDAPLNGSYLIGYYHERAYIDNLIKAAGNNKKENNNDK